jgi:predicted DNA-binding transcriptional regulator YafY
VKRWVLSFGVEAEVLEPIELREEVMDDIVTMKSKYAAQLSRISKS